MDNCVYKEAISKLKCDQLPDDDKPKPDDEIYGPCDRSNECVACQ